MNCQLRKEDELHAVCTVCGRRIRTKDHTLVKVKCPGNRQLSSVGKLKTYAQAVTRHVLSGCTSRTDEEVEVLLRICRTCEQFDPDREVCTRCGCSINKSANALRNKLRMATQHCPDRKW